jgi:hypothetical protein
MLTLNQSMSKIYDEISNLSKSGDSLIQPTSKEGKAMSIIAIYENPRIKGQLMKDTVALDDLSTFTTKVRNLINFMDTNNMTPYGDAVLLSKDLTYLNGGIGYGAIM